jgi:hypothetical protein
MKPTGTRSWKVVPFPILTMQTIKTPGWEPLLTYTIPSNATSALLYHARAMVAAYLTYCRKIGAAGATQK